MWLHITLQLIQQFTQLWIDRTRKGNLVQRALRARPAEVWQSGVSTAHREKREGWAIRVHIWTISFMHFTAHSATATTTKSGMDLTVFFDFKEVCAPPPLPIYTTCKKERSLLFIWIQGLRRNGHGWVQTACSVTKHFLKRFM